MTTEFLMDREVERVLSALMPSNRLVLRVSLHTGLRVSDVLCLRTEQLGAKVTILERKTGKRRTVGLPRALLSDLREEAGSVWVFEGRSDTGKHRTRQAVWKDVKRAATLFRLPQNVAPHSFRKAYAVELLEKYGNIEKVKRALNHSSVEVTMLYALADKLYHAKYAKRRGKP